jgi:hypothetical protein
MGSEWERKRAAGYKKQLDQGLLELGTAHLFTQQPTRVARVVAVDISAGNSVAEGERLILQKKGGRLSVMRGLKEIGRVLNPPSEIISFVEKSFGVAKGIIEVFHAEALIAEISVC